MTPLMCAVISCNNDRDSDGEECSTNTIEELIAQGAKVNAKSDRLEETALHLAARFLHAAAAKKLLEHGTNANAQDKSGRTPLHTAVGSDAIDVFRVRFYFSRYRASKLSHGTHSCGALCFCCGALCNVSIQDVLFP